MPLQHIPAHALDELGSQATGLKLGHGFGRVLCLRTCAWGSQKLAVSASCAGAVRRAPALHPRLGVLAVRQGIRLPHQGPPGRLHQPLRYLHVNDVTDLCPGGAGGRRGR